MPRRAPWSPAFVGLEPVTMAAEDDNGVRDPATPRFIFRSNDVDMGVHTRILGLTRTEEDGTRARFARAAREERNECRCSY